MLKKVLKLQENKQKKPVTKSKTSNKGIRWRNRSTTYRSTKRLGFAIISIPLLYEMRLPVNVYSTSCSVLILYLKKSGLMKFVAISKGSPVGNQMWARSRKRGAKIWE